MVLEYGLLETGQRPVLVDHSKSRITHNCNKEIFEGEKQEYSLRQLLVNVDQNDGRPTVKSAWVMPFVKIQDFISRVCYLLLLLTSSGVLASSLVMAVLRYFDYPTTASITVDYRRNATFPAITVCNNNQVNDIQVKSGHGLKSSCHHKGIGFGLQRWFKPFPRKQLQRLGYIYTVLADQHVPNHDLMFDTQSEVIG